MLTCLPNSGPEKWLKRGSLSDVSRRQKWPVNGWLVRWNTQGNEPWVGRDRRPVALALPAPSQLQQDGCVEDDRPPRPRPHGRSRSIHPKHTLMNLFSHRLWGLYKTVFGLIFLSGYLLIIAYGTLEAIIIRKKWMEIIKCVWIAKSRGIGRKKSLWLFLETDTTLKGYL